MSADRKGTPAEAGIIIALAIFIVAACFGLLAVATGYAPQQRPEKSSVQQHRTDQHGQPSPRPINGDPSAAPYQPRCSPAYSKDEDDLCQQRRMAKAAEDSAKWAFWQLVISSIAGALILPAIWYAGRSAMAATRAVETQIRLEQPFLVVQLLRIEGEDDDMGRIDIELENIGKTPAVITSIGTTTYGWESDKVAVRDLVPPILLLQGGKHPTPAYVHSDYTADMILRGEFGVSVAGRVLYEDAFGRAREFGFAYEGQRNDNMSKHEGRPVFDWVRVGGSKHNYDREIKSK